MRAGPVSIWAGNGNSTLQGGSDGDVMGGSAAIDNKMFMIDGTGDATSLGPAGTTTATGGNGDDTCWTGNGAMTISDGSGSDTVVFGSDTASVADGTGYDIYCSSTDMPARSAWTTSTCSDTATTPRSRRFPIAKSCLLSLAIQASSWSL